MNIRSSLEQLITLQKPGFLPGLALLPLAGASCIFRGIIRLRRLLYKQGIFRSCRLPCAVLSIGNITAGGTGKTPMVYYIARHLKDAGYRVAILSRGYRARSRSRGLVIADGRNVLAGPEQAGDEPFMLARMLRDVPVLAGKDRVYLGEQAVRDFSCQVIIIDDGFHYFRLQRDLDIVLINARRPFDNGWLLPRGTLREPPCSLARAGLIVLSKSGPGADTGGLENVLHGYNPHAPIFKASLAARAFRSCSGEELLPPAALKNRRAAAVCSIGDPESFFSLLASLGVIITARLAFPDHHWYSASDYRIINDAASSADLIITTEKDVAKLDETMLGKHKLFALQTRMQVAGEDQFFKAIRACVGEPIITEQR
jgi:tetraacyldisaccharide 4'-kinase